MRHKIITRKLDKFVRSFLEPTEERRNIIFDLALYRFDLYIYIYLYVCVCLHVSLYGL